MAARFAGRYLATLDLSLRKQPQDCSAWTAAYRCAALPGVPPFQHAALGISAHINFDLAQGIYQTIVDLGSATDTRALARYKHDHDQVNALLAACLGECLRLLAHEHNCEAATLLLKKRLPWSSRCILAVLRRWRSTVWCEVIRMLRARGPRERAAIVRRLEWRSRWQAWLLSSRRGGQLAIWILKPRPPFAKRPKPGRLSWAQAVGPG